MNVDTHEWGLAGLDGANPLAFLAAVGTLRTATLAWPAREITLGWHLSDGLWKPLLGTQGISDRETLLEGLSRQLARMAGHPAFDVGDNLNFTPDQFRRYAETAQELAASDDTMAAFLGSFACEGVVDDQGKQVADTALRTMRGAGHQDFVKTMRDLVGATTRDHLEHSLFSAWERAETGLGLRWDPQDDRRYALRWNEPSSDPTRTERGAHRLAVEALPLFPVHPVHRRLETTGFTRRARQTFLSWPIWTTRVSLDVVRSLLALRGLQAETLSRGELARRGVVEVFRSQRITLGKYRNFSAATPA